MAVPNPATGIIIVHDHGFLGEGTCRHARAQRCELVIGEKAKVDYEETEQA
jgi:hypothetical protein